MACRHHSKFTHYATPAPTLYKLQIKKSILISQVHQQGCWMGSGALGPEQVPIWYHSTGPTHSFKDNDSRNPAYRFEHTFPCSVMGINLITALTVGALVVWHPGRITAWAVKTTPPVEGLTMEFQPTANETRSSKSRTKPELAPVSPKQSSDSLTCKCLLLGRYFPIKGKTVLECKHTNIQDAKYLTVPS